MCGQYAPPPPQLLLQSTFWRVASRGPYLSPARAAEPGSRGRALNPEVAFGGKDSSRCSALSGLIYDDANHSNQKVHLPESNYRPPTKGCVVAVW
ncbi:hypothetical protein CEXT_403901 [Caerostris extrusa]|uniref:Uncharacterized protein n=1 Tax=Caerostris extrusa TaxID=172846 RepID=A0AAV4RJ45_CAEEX|nr:hypothetical protein CEXT_403901 [Caerostris extrusa]